MRADIGWNWPTLTLVNSVIANALKQKPKCYTIGMKINTDDFLPCALIFLVNSYYYLPSNSKTGSFIWFMATAPENFYQQYNLSHSIPKLGGACLGVGVTSSFNNLNDGLLGLHADPNGGKKLLQFYANQGMARLNQKTKLRLPRINDGRYFYYDESSASSFSSSYDKWR